MSIGEWVVELDRDLRITKVRRLTGVDPDPNNGPLGIMFVNKMGGCVYDKWTATLTDAGWGPQSPEWTWAYARERYPTDTWIFFTNAVDELGAYLKAQAWLRSHGND
jgi:hypothetical protein